MLDERYDPQTVEAEAQRYWTESAAFRVTEDLDREKFYCLSMFPYPSGRLHMGHVRNYTIGDVIARYQRMLGKNVLQPMGWDAFGLPAENAAMAHGVPPAKWTYENIEYMKAQLKRLGFGYDWEREIATCKPEYYKWEQWLFTRLFRKGLAYKALAEVNWDPVEQTVLANEQVVDGRGWRSGAPVERRKIPHWFLKITDYSEELLQGLDDLTGWPDPVKTMQRNWIGRSEGVEVDFALADNDEVIRVFTTRPDTIFGATFMAVAAEHPLALRLGATHSDIARFLDECGRQNLSEAELEAADKRGLALGVDAINPLSGERIPVWVANFVLMSYGTGAIMAVPAHDERDHAFARQYGLAIRPVVFPSDGSGLNPQQQAFTDKGMLQHSGEFSGLSSQDAFQRIAEFLESRGAGSRRVNYRLRDWGVSRQRYWGCPVPIINSPSEGSVSVPESQLPVTLPESVTVHGGGSPLQRLPEFVNVVCPKTGAPATRETDTFDTFVESSWYYARFACPDCDDAMLDERANYWLPVDQYIGGIEHAILHLLYARFFHKLMRDEGLVNSDEPFTNLLTQGMVLAETFYREDDAGKKIYFAPHEVEVELDDQGKIHRARLACDGRPVQVGRMESMSKSKKNGVDPQALIDRYGADTVRLYVMFAAPPEQALEWSDSAVEGSFRFLRRLWRLVTSHVAEGNPPHLEPSQLTESQRVLRRQVHETIAKVGDDIGRRNMFNTAIAAVMELTNSLARFEDSSPQGKAVMREALVSVVLLLSPMVPHITHALWRALGHQEAVIDVSWPQPVAAARERDSLMLVVQVNGRRRAEVKIRPGAAQAEVERAALDHSNVQRFVADQPIKKIVVVPDKLVNIVI
jgi:leucyl-tRNA synthetase